MKKPIALLFVLLLVSGSLWSQLSGTYTVGSGGNYATIAAAIDALNTSGVVAPGVTFNVLAGHTESATTTLTITATGTSTAPIVFQKSGTGANPLITRMDAGTISTSSLSADGDAIIKLSGTDYITFNGIDLTANNQGIEYGYYTFKPSGTDGCQYVTIKNSTVTMTKGTSAYVIGIYISNGPTSPSAVTGVTVTSTSGINSNIVISGNTITNVHAGIYIRGSSATGFYDSDITIGQLGAENTITNFGGGNVSATYGIYFIYVNNPTVEYNTITSATHGSTLYGVFYSTVSGIVKGNYNAFTLANNSASSLTYFIYNANTVTSEAFNNNTFAAGTLSSTGTVYLIYASNGTPEVNINNNSISGSINRTGASGSFYCYYNLGSPTSGSENIQNNNFSNITVTGSSSLYGIYSYTSTSVSTRTCSGNILSNWIGGTGSTYGYYLLSTIDNNIYNNIFYHVNVGGAVYALRFTGTNPNVYNNIISDITTSGSSVYGIYDAGTGISQVYNNQVNKLFSNATSVTMDGIYITGATTNYVFNNIVGELKVPFSGSTIGLVGIYISGGSSIGLYYNTVYLDATSTGTNFGSSAVSVSTTPVIEMINNIFVNNSTPNGTGLTVAYRRSTTTLTSYSVTSNNNNFYAGTPSASNLIFYDGTNSLQTLDQYKAFVAPRDISSVTELSPFVNVSTSPYDLHLKTTVPTQMESGGKPVTTPSITTDFDGDLRNTSTPDIGADEGNFILLDIKGPLISYTPLLNTPSTINRNFEVAITDLSGVPTSGIGQPRLYWKINNGTYSTVTPGSVSGSNYTFSFGSGVVLGDTVRYYIVAQDNIGNVSVSPSVGASGLTSNPPAASTPPTSPSYYVIVGAPLCGDYIIGSGGAYSTLNAAISDLNNRGLSCPVRFLLNDVTLDIGTSSLNINIQNENKPSGTNTVTIKPNAGVTPTIQGTVDSGPVLNVQDNYIIIDGSNAAGGTTRDMTITNLSTTVPQVVRIASTTSTPTSNTTLKNCNIINGANTSTAVIIYNADGTGGYFSNITIQNNSIQKAYIGIYAMAAVAAGNGNGLLIKQNDLNASGTNSIRLVGIYVQGVDGATINNNNIGNINNTIDASNCFGIWLATGTVNTLIENNIIDGVSNTSSATRGIGVSSGNANANITITDNVISNITTSSYYTPYGIYIYSTTTGVNIIGNNLSTVLNSNTGGYGARGISVITGQANGSYNLINNAVSDVKCTGDASLTYWGIGISLEGATGGANIYHNSVNLSGTYAGYTSSTVSAALYLGTGTGGYDIRNNILVNTYDNTGSSSDKSYAIYAAGTSAILTNINYNDYYVSGTPGVIGYLGAGQTSFTDWQTATGQDGASINIDPIFTSATNLLPTNNSMNNLGVYLSTVTNDINGILRTNPPDMGAYEFGEDPQVITTTASPLTYNAATLNGSFNAAGTTFNTFFDYGLTTALGNTVSGSPAQVTGNTAIAVSAGISGLLPSTTYYFRARGVTMGGLTVYGNTVSFTTTVPPPIVTTEAATSITSSAATLNGTVNANGGSATVEFEWGLTTSYGNTVTAVQSPVSGSVVTPVSAGITGLMPNTLYNFRVKATNEGGTTYGDNLTFTTAAAPPVAVTNAATSITANSATLNGTVTANNSNTTVTFEWGTTTAYGNTINATPNTVTGLTPTDVSANLTGLNPGITYHYRVKAVNVAGTAYGNDMTFLTGCPMPGAAGAISGPTSVCQSSTGNVYTVAAIVNATGYSWTVPSGATITAGANTNTITVSYGASAVSGNVSVYGTNSCGSGASSSLAVTVNPRPVPTISGPATVCAGTSGNVYTTQTGMSNYTWTVSAGGTITAGQGSNSVTVTWNTAGGQNVTVTYTNAAGCSASTPATYNVTVNALPTPTISGNTNLCQGSTGVNYTTQSGMTNYVWAVSSGGNITGGQGTNAITVNWNGSGAQTVSVNYINASGCTASSPSVLNVTVNPTPTPSINGPANPCLSPNYYDYFTEAGMSNYQWTVSSGGSIYSGQGTANLRVIWNTTGLQSISVSYVSPQGCMMPGPYSKTIFVQPLPNAAGAITGSGEVCAGESGVVYSVGNILNATSYQWTVPGGATIVSGQGSNTITVNFASNAISGEVSVAGMNGCGLGVPSFLAVIVKPLPGVAGTIAGHPNVCQGATNVTYSVAPIANASGYVWSLPVGASITAGANTNSIKVSFSENAVSGNISVYGTNACGNGISSPEFFVTVNPIPPTPTITVSNYTLTSSAPEGNQWYLNGVPIPDATGQSYTATETGNYYVIVTLNGCSSAPSNTILVIIEGMISLDHNSFKVYPIPNDGRFTIELVLQKSGIYTLEIFNSLGLRVYSSEIYVDGKHILPMDLSYLPSGVYTVTLFNTQLNAVRRIVISK
ncbi:MAG TPA: hypothetical protein PLG54_04610 [Bacteroidales bacterium]|jgi:hypothetical protein|nr:hypothetical protein [Bacteroidales bacterium]HOE58976.1 hypothetical protein [Bacteroidales bacterium]HOR04780.1 hypothetical protein [Bacteroidales bacterium]HOU34551.1 hypothetical protein [Bacteroidales bacterium]HPL33936.1 hypothetical protein [Bacteroidales bacterium]